MKVIAALLNEKFDKQKYEVEKDFVNIFMDVVEKLLETLEEVQLSVFNSFISDKGFENIRRAENHLLARNGFETRIILSKIASFLLEMNKFHFVDEHYAVNNFDYTLEKKLNSEYNFKFNVNENNFNALSLSMDIDPIPTKFEKPSLGLLIGYAIHVCIKVKKKCQTCLEALIENTNIIGDFARPHRNVRDSKHEVTDMYCGAFLPKPILSQGTKLDLQCVVNPITQYDDNNKGNYYGFKTEFRFLKNFGIINGQQLGHDCIFIYNSTVQQTGLFMSPNFPVFYPHNIICHYYFYGDSEEKVLIHFDFFDVEGIVS
uniref:CUB domain-containing protein n=1 Tax=Glossina brevipalpis TaxID=37001 RepID=A0A1A9WQF8_9MUSC